MGDHLRFFSSHSPDSSRSHGHNADPYGPEFADPWANPGAYSQDDYIQMARDEMDRLISTDGPTTSWLYSDYYSQPPKGGNYGPPSPPLARPTPLQKKMNVGSTSDPLEKEADAVADFVMRDTKDCYLDPPVSPFRQPMRRGQDSEAVARQGRNEQEQEMQRNLAGMDEDAKETLGYTHAFEKSDEEEDLGTTTSIYMQRDAIGPGAEDGPVSPDLEQRIKGVRNSGGEKLPDSEREFFESRMGRDFGDVRIHTGSEAAQVSQDVNAKAFTIGRDVVFGEGEYNPGTQEGRRLMAHELTHTVQQGAASKKPDSLKNDANELRMKTIQRDAGEATDEHYSPARNFQQLIDLVQTAEEKLSKAGYDVDERIKLLRGIFYGTEWSADYKKEKSETRNRGFLLYTASSPYSDDPRELLGPSLFQALQHSQDISDGDRHIDFGHLLIGLDARSSIFSRSMPIPTQGGSGLQISTWLGDLGGGAGMLAFRRVQNPAMRAVSVFQGTDFGGSINLEGDIAGYLVGRDPEYTDGPSPISIKNGEGIAQALKDYLLNTKSDSPWAQRSSNFIQMLGGKLDQNKDLLNKDELIADLTSKIEEFACWYISLRLWDQDRMDADSLNLAAKHITGASGEVATVFVDALIYSMENPEAPVKARGPGPNPSPPGPVNSTCSVLLNIARGSE